MASRISQNASDKGVQFAAPSDNAGAMIQRNIYYNPVGAVNSGLRALQGTTVRGQVVGTIEKWSDGSVYDTGNNRYLYCGTDFDPAVLNKS